MNQLSDISGGLCLIMFYKGFSFLLLFHIFNFTCPLYIYYGLQFYIFIGFLCVERETEIDILIKNRTITNFSELLGTFLMERFIYY